MKVLLPWGSMLTKTKKKVKIKKEKSNDMEIRWVRNWPQNLARIHAAHSTKPEFMDDGRQRHDSSSDDTVKQS